MSQPIPKLIFADATSMPFLPDRSVNNLIVEAIGVPPSLRGKMVAEIKSALLNQAVKSAYGTRMYL